MADYLRSRIDGGMYFLTLVTHERARRLTTRNARGLLRRAMAEVQASRPFDLRAVVLLPDHLHMLWRLPEGDAEYSGRVALIKRHFTRAFLSAGGREGATTASRRRHRVRGVWEKRFWEHAIRDHRDFKRHLDYIHFNPVKHGLVARASDWPWSSFRRYVALSEYELDWPGPTRLAGGGDIEPDTWPGGGQ
jgi:putative transposase